MLARSRSSRATRCRRSRLRYHTTVARLVALNHLPGDGDLIYAGQTLKVPGGHSHSGGTTPHGHDLPHRRARATRSTASPRATTSSPLVIARRNHLPKSLVVMLGQRLAIPHRVTHPLHSAPSGGTRRRPRRRSHDRSYLAHRAEPSQTQVGVDDPVHRGALGPRPASRARRSSWQESGWNMRAVSAGRRDRGDAGDALHRQLPGRPTSCTGNLNLFDAQDNVTAGVALLSVLTHEARSTRQAVAGYYQGLQSVRDHGMYASTKQYVANVMALRAHAQKRLLTTVSLTAFSGT